MKTNTKGELTMNEFIAPTCPICDSDISGIIGSERLWCFECKTYWNLDLRLETD